MKNKHQIVYIWSFIILASFILLLLYTPLGGGLKQPSPKVFRTMNRSVQFSGGITNSPRIKSSQQNIGTENEILSASDLPSYARKTSVKRSSPKNQTSTYAVVSKTTPNSNSTSGMGGGSYMIGGKGSPNSSGNSYSSNLSQPFSEQAINNPPMRKTLGVDESVADPGGDPTGAPLPVGDGIPVLIAFAFLFGFYKYKKKLTLS